MKTTIDLPDSLLREAKALAAREGMTLTELMESGLRRAVERLEARRAFRLADASWGHGGLIDGYEWSRVRELIYDRSDEGGERSW